MALPAEQHPQIAKYDLQDELGHGGMATVYRAIDRRLDREVAVKLLHRHLRDSAEVARRFTAEARAVARLKHPNIVEIYDVSDEDSPERFLVAELVRGPSLRRLLTERPVLPAEITACIGAELAAALSHAHERGVIHRDVKPENVLFGIPWQEPAEAPEPQRGEVSDPVLVSVKLTDFGIAKLLNQQGVTATGQVLGSPAYMAPEQIDADEVDARADVFSLGVLLYESMVGRLPFDGKTPGQVLRAILKGHVSPADKERPEVGARWARIVNRALAPQVDQRYSTMAALRADLEAELALHGITRPRDELTRFFRDPEGYEGALRKRLIALLIDQGTRALRQRDRMAAADAINRAGALAPGDPRVSTLVKKLVHADRFERWRGRLAVGGLCCFGVVVLGLGGWKLTRPPPLIRARAMPAVSLSLPAATASPTASASAPPDGSSSASPPASGAPAASSVGGHRLASPHLSPRPSDNHPAGPMRKVRLSVYPPSARWRLDGQPLPDVPFHETFLPIGSQHTLEAYILPGNPCCEETSTSSFTVLPDNGTTDPQLVPQLVLKLKPAILQSKAPEGHTLRCPVFFEGARKANGTQSIPIGSTEKEGTCFLVDVATINQRKIVLRAGETFVLQW